MGAKKRSKLDNTTLIIGSVVVGVIAVFVVGVRFLPGSDGHWSKTEDGYLLRGRDDLVAGCVDGYVDVWVKPLRTIRATSERVEVVYRAGHTGERRQGVWVVSGDVVRPADKLQSEQFVEYLLENNQLWQPLQVLVENERPGRLFKWDTIRNFGEVHDRLESVCETKR